MLCTQFRLILVFSKTVLGKRLWLEHVCKVCAQLRHLQHVYNRSCSEAFAPLGGICVVIVGNGAKSCDYNWLVWKLCQILSEYS